MAQRQERPRLEMVAIPTRLGIGNAVVTSEERPQLGMEGKPMRASSAVIRPSVAGGRSVAWSSGDRSANASSNRFHARWNTSTSVPVLSMEGRRTTGELAFYRCFTPHSVPLAVLVRVAGTRWSIEELFQAAKGCVGLDHYQVRNHRSWNRHITLAMLALAILAVTAARQPDDPGGGRIRLTVNEIRRLVSTLILTPATTAATVLGWSDWRRRHQARARKAHYQARLCT